MSDRCFIPGCDRPAPFGFNFGRQSRHTCREHQSEGRAWLDSVKGAGAAQEREGALL